MLDLLIVEWDVNNNELRMRTRKTESKMVDAF